VEISAARGTFKVIHRLLHIITVFAELEDDLVLIMGQPNYVSIELARLDREAAAVVHIGGFCESYTDISRSS
jgi:hypothetical protein